MTRRRALAASTAAIAGLLLARQAGAQGAPVSLFKVVGARDEVVIGLTTAELDRLGTGAAVERIARALVANGQLTVWRYSVGRAADGSTRYAANGRVAILKNDAMRIEPYAAAIPVAAPPAE